MSLESDIQLASFTDNELLTEVRRRLPAMLAHWRAVNGLKMREAAIRLSVPYRTYQNWERGVNAPRGLSLKWIMKEIGGGK